MAGNELHPRIAEALRLLDMAHILERPGHASCDRGALDQRLARAAAYRLQSRAVAAEVHDHAAV